MIGSFSYMTCYYKVVHANITLNRGCAPDYIVKFGMEWPCIEETSIANVVGSKERYKQKLRQGR